MQPPGWRGGSPGPLGRHDACRGSASRERNHGVGDHPIPFRTRQLSPTSPKVLRRQAAGGQVVPLAGGAFLRSGRPDGTAGPADAAAPTGSALPLVRGSARRGGRSAPRRGHSGRPSDPRRLPRANLCDKMISTIMIDTRQGVFCFKGQTFCQIRTPGFCEIRVAGRRGLAWHARGNLRVARVASVA